MLRPFPALLLGSLIATACSSETSSNTEHLDAGGDSGTAASGGTGASSGGSAGKAIDAGATGGSAGAQNDAGATGGSAGAQNDAGATDGSAGAQNDAGATDGSAGAQNDAGATDGSASSDSGTEAGGDADSDACVPQTVTLTPPKQPLDAIFVIDNSGSMSGEIQALQDNINDNFAKLIGDSGIDYRVVLLARHGSYSSGQSVCVEAPLSGIPAGGCSPPPAQPVNTATFFHYSEEIGSHNSLCKIIDTFRRADEFNLAPNGWEQWLRVGALKMFVEISDDGVSCTSTVSGQNFNDGDTVAGGTTAGDAFDVALRTLSPEMFGYPSGERDYRFYSIVGLKENAPGTDPWPPSSPIQDTRCSNGSAGQGTGYQRLSILTQALRYPSCENASFGVYLRSAVDDAKAALRRSCQVDRPSGVSGSYTVNLVAGGATAPLSQVADAGACSASGFYESGQQIVLCPTSCSALRADSGAQLTVEHGCSGSD